MNLYSMSGSLWEPSEEPQYDQLEGWYVNEFFLLVVPLFPGQINLQHWLLMQTWQIMARTSRSTEVDWDLTQVPKCPWRCQSQTCMPGVFDGYEYLQKLVESNP